MKHKHLLEEFLEEEIGEYSYFTIETIELDEEYKDIEYYSVKITGGNNTKYISFKLDGKKIEVELSEGSYHEVCTYEYTVKYFWMCLLNWD